MFKLIDTILLKDLKSPLLSDDVETCDTAEQRLFHRNKGFCLATIISTSPRSTK